jgi:hypothetical protein
MRPVTVRIMHPEPGPAAGPLERWLAEVRAAFAIRHRDAFLAAGATGVAIVSGPPDDVLFGARLRAIVETDRPAGLVVLGAGAIPLATRADRRAFVAAAAADDRRALANNRYSADIVAIACATDGLAGLPDLPSDNMLPRWLAETAGYTVDDLARRWRLAVDIDGPLDVVLIGGALGSGAADLAPVLERIAGVRATAADPRRELLVAGRTSATSLAWLERHTASRTRALIEERGLRTRVAGQHGPVSVLGTLLDRDEPEALGTLLATLGDAAIIDSRVLLAHHYGSDEAGWPAPEDRYASDLLLPDGIADPWLRALTASAADAPIPVLLGGHTLVGPGLRLVLGRRAAGVRWS